MSTRFDDALLDSFRTRGDDLADAALPELCGSGDWILRLEERARAGNAACRRLLDHVREVPGWVEFDRMRMGYARARRFAIHAGLALLVGSLVESYASASGAKVLVRTGRLDADTARRVHETAVFVHMSGSSNGPRPGTDAHRRIVQTRLVHAAVRRGMQRRADWDPSWGIPVNQEDYASTLLMFSLVFVRSLRRLGVEIDPAVADAIHHHWRYVGWVMGVDERLVTRDTREEQALYDAITRRQFVPDDDSRALVASLLRTMAGRAPLYLSSAALAAASRRVHGDRLADALGIPRARLWERALSPLALGTRLASRVCEVVPGAPDAAEALGTWIADRTLRGFEVAEPVE